MEGLVHHDIGLWAEMNTREGIHLTECLRGAKWQGDSPAEAHIALGNEIDEDRLFRLAQGLRQILLTRVPGWAVTAMKLEYREEDDKGKAKPWRGLPHQFGRLPGVVENVREIARNLQHGIFRLPQNEKEFTVHAEVAFEADVTPQCKEVLLGDWFEDDEAHMVLNPEQPVFTLQDTVGQVVIDFKIEKGIGYRSALDNERRSRQQGLQDTSPERPGKAKVVPWLYLDADFNPVRRVGFRVKNEDDGKFIVFTIETRPNIKPKEAVDTACSSIIAELAPPLC